MRKSKRSAAVLLCGISLLIKPAYAFFPVFDFTEIVPVLQQVKTGKDSIDTVRNSLMSLNDTKKAIGGIGSLGSFSESLDIGSVSGLLALSDHVTETNKGTTQLAVVSSQVVDRAVSETISAHAESVNGFVDEIQQKIFKNKTQNEIVLSYNDLFPMNLRYEEEEEEEEVSDKKNKDDQDALMSALDSVMVENKQIATELNDVLETLLTVLNRAATVNTASFAELKTVVKETKVITDEDKALLKERIEKLSEKQQDVTDRAAIVIENIKSNYNDKYTQVIEDGTENFIKVARAYVRGDEEKEVVEEVGQKLKQNATALNVVSDSEVLQEIEQISKDILAETEELKAEMENILNKK